MNVRRTILAGAALLIAAVLPARSQQLAGRAPRKQNVKPVVGRRVNRRHRLGRSLAWCIPCNEGVGLPQEVVTGTRLYFGGTTAGNLAGPAPSSQTNTPPVWTSAKRGFWSGPALDMFPGAAVCTPVVFGADGTHKLWEFGTLPTRGFSTAWLFNPANTTSGLTRVGDTDNGNPFGLYVNQAGAGKITCTAYDFAGTSHVFNFSFAVADEWILLVETWRAGEMFVYANLDASGNRIPYMSQVATYGTGDPATATNADPIFTWKHAGLYQNAVGTTEKAGTFSPNASYSTTNHNWLADTTRYQGLFGSTWCWFNDQLALADAQLLYSDMWGMLE